MSATNGNGHGNGNGSRLRPTYAPQISFGNILSIGMQILVAVVAVMVLQGDIRVASQQIVEHERRLNSLEGTVGSMKTLSDQRVVMLVDIQRRLDGVEGWISNRLGLGAE